MVRWFINLNTSTKLVAFYATFVILFCAVVTQGLTSSRAATKHQEAELSAALKVTALAKEASIERLRIVRATLFAIIETDPAVIAAHMRKVDESEAVFKKLVADAESSVTDPAAHAALVEAGRAIPAWMDLSRQAIAVSPQGNSKGDPAKMTEILKEQARQGGEIDAKLTIVGERIKAKAADDAAARQVEDDHALYMSIGIVALVLVVGGFTTRLLVSSIANPLRAVIDVLSRIAEGDLTARTELDRTDEIGQMATALNTTVDAMRMTLVEVTEVSREVSSASSELAANASAISSGAQEQAASLEETAASLEEISATVKQNTDSAQEASHLANSARDAAERGGQVVSAAVAAMEDITRSSKKIADIIATIDEIAFQTNLLALNAAVEAARAGEQGRGFGVVASEVRSLAQRTGSAAKEIRGLIAESTGKVEIGTRQVNESGRTLGEIVTSVKRVTDMVAEIAAASREQNTGLDQVNTAVTQVDQVTQSNAAQTEELSATATALSDRSTRLQALVDAFELGEAPAPAPVVVAARPVAKVAPRPAHSRGRLAKVIPLSSRRPPPLPESARAGGYEEY